MHIYLDLVKAEPQSEPLEVERVQDEVEIFFFFIFKIRHVFKKVTHTTIATIFTISHQFIVCVLHHGGAVVCTVAISVQFYHQAKEFIEILLVFSLFVNHRRLTVEKKDTPVLPFGVKQFFSDSSDSVIKLEK